MMKSEWPLFDTHCHLDFERIGDVAVAIQQAKAVGVEKFMVPSIGQANWGRVIELAQRFDCVTYSLGLHPYFCSSHDEVHLQVLEQHLAQRERGCVAIGECGLDYAVKELDKNRQQYLLDVQLGLAKRYQLPVILHQRKSHQDLIKQVKSHQLNCGGVIHGFSGSLQQAHDWLNLGFFIGIGGTITYPRANKTRETVKRLPLESVLLETDAPDMPLFGHQGQANHPRMLLCVLKEFNNLRAESKQTIAAQIWSKSNNLFSKCEIVRGE